MKSLNGSELAGFIKERHSSQVRRLNASKIYPKLAIVQLKDDPVINTYVKLKKRYGSDIGISVDIHISDQVDVADLLARLNADETVHGIIVQLPLPDPARTDEIVNLVSPVKDVDSLGLKSEFEPATPMAILWLLAGYNIDLKDKKIVLIGKGKLVGAPLHKILKGSGLDVEVVDRTTSDLASITRTADILITAANSAEIIGSDMIARDAVVVDAGVASEDGKTVGNLKPEVYERDDLTITPTRGGVGPLTVCALFENVIRAAENAKK
jgi:methylenetetrahydrofolate dehydrogenase (NADP+)/methenyltetrahydrofolate cyclohydrolase